MCGRNPRDTGFSESITPLRFRMTVPAGLCGHRKGIKLAQAAAGHAASAMTQNYPIKGRGAFAAHKHFRRRQNLGAGRSKVNCREAARGGGLGHSFPPGILISHGIQTEKDILSDVLFL